jgi:hypothetical protein
MGVEVTLVKNGNCREKNIVWVPAQKGSNEILVDARFT